MTRTPVAAVVLLSCLAGAGSVQAQSPAAIRLTLDDAIARGLDTSHRLAEIRAREQGAQAAVRGAQAADKPIVSATAGYTRTNHVPEFFFLQPSGARLVVYPDIPDNVVTRVALQWPIYTSGRTDALERAASAEAQAVAADIETTRADLRLEIVRAYWAAATAREAVRVLEEAATRADAQVTDSRRRFEVGLIPPNDHDAGESGGRVHPRSVRQQRHSGAGWIRCAPGAEVLSAAEPAGQCRHRRAELLRDRLRGAERRQLRRPRRSPDLRKAEGLHPLFLSQDVQRAGDFFPDDIAVAEGRVNEQNLAHNAVFDYNRTVSNSTVMSARFGFARTLFIFDNQGLGLQAVEPRTAGVDRRQRGSRDVPAVRRRRHGDARRERPPLQRVHELHRCRRPDQGARRAHAQDRLRGADAARQRLGGAERRHLQLPHERDPGAESQPPPAAPPASGSRRSCSASGSPNDVADPELEERRGATASTGPATRRTTGGSTRG